jgi:hypothetical protein
MHGLKKEYGFPIHVMHLKMLARSHLRVSIDSEVTAASYLTVTTDNREGAQCGLPNAQTTIGYRQTCLVPGFARQCNVKQIQQII